MKKRDEKIITSALAFYLLGPSYSFLTTEIILTHISLAVLFLKKKIIKHLAVTVEKT